MAANRAPRKPGAADDRPSNSRTNKAAPAKPGTAQAKPGTAPKKPAAGRSAASGRSGATAVRKPGKSIVSKKQPPWGLIVASVVVVAFAIGVVAFAVTRHKSSNSASKSSSATSTAADGSDRYHLPEIAAAKAIQGVIFKVEPNHNHVTSSVSYDTSPPIGGDHSQVWGDCTGTVYAAAIANENAVHDLEHGAVWITYRPGLAASQVASLAAMVTGQDHLLMSPYPGLKTLISLQAWGYQLTVDSASDPRIASFIKLFRASHATTPETDQSGAAISCSEPSFKLKPSTLGHPTFNG